jgi:hypothetical protein
VALAFTGCRRDTVRLGFHPAVGATYSYTTTVDSSTRTSLLAKAVAPQHVTFASRERVLSIENGVTRVEVALDAQGSGSRTYVMQFDRAAQLTKVESVEGIPTDALGNLGITEIFPAAAGAPPDRPLRPGDRWTIDDNVQLEQRGAPANLSGQGQLVELGVVDGRRTATVRSTTLLPVRTASGGAASSQVLDGVQRTDLLVTYDLADGAVASVVATTTGQYTLTVSPPNGSHGQPVVGDLEVVVRSTTTRR